MKEMKILTVLLINILLLSGTVYTTDNWSYLQPVFLVSGIIGIYLVFTLTSAKVTILVKNFVLYSIFTLCCILSALINEDIDLLLGTLLLYYMYLSLGIAYPAIFGTKLKTCNCGRITICSYIYSHLPIVIIPLLIGGVNKIPYSGIFYNPNSYGAITATLFTVIFSRISHIIDCLTQGRRIKISLVLVNGSLLLITFILIMLSKSRTSFFSILIIIIFYLLNSLLCMIISGRISISVILRAAAVLLIILSISTLILFQTGMLKLFEDTIAEKMIKKSDDLLSGRASIWYTTIYESKLFGNGKDYFTKLGKGAHNTYISLLGQYGVIPALLYFCFLLNLLYYSFICIIRNKKNEYRYFPMYSILLFMLLSIGEGMFFKDSMLLAYLAVGSIINSLAVESDIDKCESLIDVMSIDKIMAKRGRAMEEINYRELLLIIRKRLWIIVLITVLFTGASGLMSYYIFEPEYQTFTTLMIGRPQEYRQGIEYDDIMINQKLVSTYGEIAKSRIVAKEFMSNLGLSLTYEEIDEKIDVTLVKDTEIIKISVKDKDGEMAAEMANEIAAVFIRHVARIMNIENIQVIDKAEVPLKPDKPKPVINMIISSVLGAILSILSIFLHEYFDNTVKTQEDIEKHFMLPVIGVIPKV